MLKGWSEGKYVIWWKITKKYCYADTKKKNWIANSKKNLRQRKIAKVNQSSKKTDFTLDIKVKRKKNNTIFFPAKKSVRTTFRPTQEVRLGLLHTNERNDETKLRNYCKFNFKKECEAGFSKVPPRPFLPPFSPWKKNTWFQTRPGKNMKATTKTEDDVIVS